MKDQSSKEGDKNMGKHGAACEDALAIVHVSSEKYQDSRQIGKIKANKVEGIDSSAAGVSQKTGNSGKYGKTTSAYRGVTKHRLTQRFEAHFWDSSYIRKKPVRITVQMFPPWIDILITT